MTIVSLRGTHGSGKSTVVKSILDRYTGMPVYEEGQRRPVGYNVKLPCGPLFIVGPYLTACGGCDAIQPYARIWPLVTRAAEKGEHVLFEGALVSNSYGNIGRDSEVYGDEFVFAMLDTPLDECLARIRKRREARGELKPLNPHHCARIYHSVQRTIKTAEQAGRRIVIVPHETAVKSVLKLFGISIR
jgi:predicted kinase